MNKKFVYQVGNNKKVIIFKLILQSKPSSSKWRRSVSFQTNKCMCSYVTTSHILRCKYWR